MEVQKNLPKPMSKTNSGMPPKIINNDIPSRQLQKGRNYSTLNLPSIIRDQLVIPMTQSRESSPRAADEAISTIGLIVTYELFQRNMVSKPERDQFKSK